MGKNNRVKKTQVKLCPGCNKPFTTAIGTKERTTCSYACSNIYFRSTKLGKTNYKNKCFYFNQRKCIVCGESKVVDVHHFDLNRDNDEITNLIPLCPTHHKYMHSRYRSEVIDKVDQFRKFAEKYREVPWEHKRYKH